MDCDPDSLLSAAASFRGLSQRMMDSLGIHLLCEWSNGPDTFEEIVGEGEGEFIIGEGGGEFIIGE